MVEKRDPSKIGKASNEKGKRFERDIRRKLTEATGREFFRVPRSGGLITSMPILKELGGYANAFRGDLFAKGLAFLMELKNRPSKVQVYHILMGEGVIFDWWQEAVSESEKVLIPMLVFNTNTGKRFCMIDQDGFDTLCPKEYIHGVFKDRNFYVIPVMHLIEDSDVWRNLFIDNMDLNKISSRYANIFKRRLEGKDDI